MRKRFWNGWRTDKMNETDIRDNLIKFIKSESKKTINYKEEISKIISPKKDIIIYGAGLLGYLLGRFLLDFADPGEHKVVCYLDKRADEIGELLGYPVYKPDDYRINPQMRSNMQVLLALNLQSDDEYSNLIKHLQKLGYTDVINKMYNTFCFTYNMCESYNGELLMRDTDNILSAFDLIEDEGSKQIFVSVIKSHMRFERTKQFNKNSYIEYFNVGVPQKREIKTFVDCGASIGDTFADLIKNFDIDNYIAIEPNSQKICKLSAVVSRYIENTGSIMQCVILPVGVSDKNNFYGFTNYGDCLLSDMVDDITVQVVRLDDVLIGYNNIMIKMDIEGEEIAALNGAKRIIKTSKPDLAICVYHRKSDLWQIPLMVKEWVPEYNIYIRKHECCDNYAVMYATTANHTC